jgi:UDP-N-acetylmuramoyl-L-alanyl-D-glutamate--2,6-diaminopimelate ligase
VVAGKGHETGQYVAGAVLPFDDRQVTALALHQQADARRVRPVPEDAPWAVNR